MKCTKCNSDLRSDYNFCPLCGTEVSQEKIVIKQDLGDYPDGFNPELYGL